jgi:lipoprotein-releasing system permease protein
MIFSPFERMVAWRYLRAKRQEGFVSVIALFSLLGIMLGVATLIIVMSVMNGFRTELFSRVLGLNGHISVLALQGPMQDYGEIASRISMVDGVARVNPMIEGQGLVTGRGSPRGVMVRGMLPEDFRTKPILSEHIVTGSTADFGGTQVAIGRRLAIQLGVGVGDKITLISPQGRNTVFGSSPRFASFTVGVVFDVGMYEFDSGFIFMPLEAAQAFFELPSSVSMLEVFVKDLKDIDDVKAEVSLATQAPARVLDWRQQNASFTNALEVERNVMFLILSLIIMVAAFNIISSLIMLVKDKGRDIAILRTMGASRGMVMRIFFLTGGSIGVIGTLLGLGLGVAFAENIESIRQFLQGLTGTELFSAEIYFLSQLPAEINYREVMQVVGMALGLSFAATIYPSWRAAKIDPVEALRYE